MWTDGSSSENFFYVFADFHDCLDVTWSRTVGTIEPVVCFVLEVVKSCCKLEGMHPDDKLEEYHQFQKMGVTGQFPCKYRCQPNCCCDLKNAAFLSSRRACVYMISFLCCDNKIMCTLYNVCSV